MNTDSRDQSARSIRDYVQQLVERPAETLDTEYKDWINVASPEGKATIVRTCLALRNHGGGYLVIGVGETNGVLRRSAAPAFDPQEKFIADHISQLVAGHSRQIFEVSTYFAEVDGVSYPVIHVSNGVRTPVVSCKAIRGDGGKVLLKEDVVYVRTLQSNNSVSSAIANEDGWESVMRTCVANRETDIGGFLRRNLTDDNMASIKRSFSSGMPQLVFSGGPISQYVLEKGQERFSRAVEKNKIVLPQHGSFEVAIRIPSGTSEFSTNRQFLGLLTATNPNYWSWPLWLNATTFSDAEVQPQVVNGAWETALILLDEHKWRTRSIDFWFASPLAQFYHRRGFWEDHLMPAAPLQLSPHPRTILDCVVQLTFVAESLVVGLAFARAMGCSQEDTKLEFSFRWSDLRDRVLVSNLRPNRLFVEQLRAVDGEFIGSCFVPLGASPLALHQYVHQITKPLFHLFQGHEFEGVWVEQFVNEFITRKAL